MTPAQIWSTYSENKQTTYLLHEHILLPEQHSKIAYTELGSVHRYYTGLRQKATLSFQAECIDAMLILGRWPQSGTFIPGRVHRCYADPRQMVTEWHFHTRQSAQRLCSSEVKGHTFISGRVHRCYAHLRQKAKVTLSFQAQMLHWS